MSEFEPVQIKANSLSSFAKQLIQKSVGCSSVEEDLETSSKHVKNGRMILHEGGASKLPNKVTALTEDVASCGDREFAVLRKAIAYRFPVIA